MPYVLVTLAGYLIGSIPFAYLLVRWRRGVELHRTGSTNVGASNALATTGSRRLGLTVLLLDALKGALAVVVGWLTPSLLHILQSEPPGMVHSAFWPGMTALVGAVAGHNYNVWLSLRAKHLVGGKGLATTAGGLSLTMPGLLPIWGVLFVTGRWGFARSRGIYDVIPGNAFATALSPVAALLLYGVPEALAVGLLALLVLPKHTRQLRALVTAPYGVHPVTGTNERPLHPSNST